MNRNLFLKSPEESRQVSILRTVYAGLFLYWVLILLLVKTGNPFQWSLSRKILLLISLILLMSAVRIPDLWKWLDRPFAINSALVLGASVLGLTIVQLFMMTSFSRLHVLGAWPNYGVVPDLRFTLNDIGMRDIHHEFDKPSGTYRIVVLGDSFATGQGVTVEQYFPQILRDLSPDHVEVILIATQGWSTYDQLIAFQTLGKCYSPDMVIVGAVTNDLEPPRSDTLSIYLDQNEEERVNEEHVAVKNVRSQEQWQIFSPVLAIDITYLMDYATNQIAGQLDLRQDYAEYEASLYDSQEQDDAIDQVELWQTAVENLYDEIVSINALPFAFVLPSPRNYNDNPTLELSTTEHEFLASGFEEVGFSTLDLLPAYLENFGEVGYHRLWALPNDGHPGAEIHEFYGDTIWKTIEPVIEDRKDLPAVPDPCVH